jgi:CheY-like chemotaxis protein
MPNILIFESDPVFAIDLCRALETRGCVVTVASDAKSGLKAAEQTRPDLIVLGIELPDMDGYLVCRTLKRNAALKAVPIIITNNGATEEVFEMHRKLRDRANDLLSHVAAHVPIGAITGVRSAVVRPAEALSEQVAPSARRFNSFNSGTKLARRLDYGVGETAEAQATGCFLVIFVGFLVAHLWNDRASLFRDVESGSVIAGFAVLVGVFAASMVRSALIGRRVEPTVVEVSVAEVSPGQSFDVWVCQSGEALRVERMAVNLICRRTVWASTNDDGDPSRPITEVLSRALLSERTQFVVTRPQPLEMSATAVLPVDARFGRQPAWLRKKEIDWCIEVQGKVEHCPKFTRYFSLSVVARS